jgi:hypothetical protein
MRLSVFVLLVTIGIGFVFYLSWLPSPILSNEPFIPGWLSGWADNSANDTLRTGVPFAVLGLLIGAYLSASRRFWLRWLVSWLILIIVVTIAEVGQLFLTYRVFDWRDIGWGIMGAGIGLGLSAAWISVTKRVKALLSNRN